MGAIPLIASSSCPTSSCPAGCACVGCASRGTRPRFGTCEACGRLSARHGRRSSLLRPASARPLVRGSAGAGLWQGFGPRVHTGAAGEDRHGPNPCHGPSRCMACSFGGLGGVVQIRVTRETWNPLIAAALATFGVTHKPPASNHAEICGYAVYYGADLRRNSSLTYRSAQPCAGPCNNALTMQRSIDGTPSCHPGYRARDIAGRFLRTLIDTRLQELTEIALRSRLVPVSRSAAHRSSR